MARDIEYVFWFDPETGEPRFKEFDDDDMYINAEQSIEQLADQHGEVWNYTLIMDGWYRYVSKVVRSDYRAKSISIDEVPAVFRTMLLLHLP